MITFLFGILVFPFIFWPLVLLATFLLFLGSEQESPGCVIASVLIGIMLYAATLGSFGAFVAMVMANPMIILSFFVIYMLCGTAWAYFKWFVYVNDKAKIYKKELTDIGNQKFALRYSAGEYYAKCDGRKYHSYEEIMDLGLITMAPIAFMQKNRITMWIVLWIPSAIWFVVNDPIRRAANTIFDNIRGTFQSISNNAFKD